jgi:hypothetical protein
VKTRKLVDGRTIAAHRNDGLRKRCNCGRRAWPKCEHDWHFNFQWRNPGQEKPTPYRFSLDRYLGRRLKDKDDARAEAEKIRVAIRAGTFVLKPAPVAAPTTADALTLTEFGAIWHKHCPVLTGRTAARHGARGIARG